MSFQMLHSLTLFVEKIHVTDNDNVMQYLGNRDLTKKGSDGFSKSFFIRYQFSQ